jgi:hypothetical protein
MMPKCKMCMVERKEIFQRIQKDRNKIINDNSDIFSSCKCKGRFNKFGRYLHVETCRFHKFGRYLDVETLRTH